MVKYMNMTEDEIDAEIEKIEREFDKIQMMKTLTNEDIDKQSAKLAKLTSTINDLMCVLQVEHFLEAGPGGKDPI
jgi:hypothetical protein